MTQSRIPGSVILGAWIAGILLLSAFPWVLSGPARDHILMRQLNRVLREQESPWSLAEAAPRSAQAKFPFMGGPYRFKNNVRSSVEVSGYVFPLFSGGMVVPCLALVFEGERTELLPLTRHGEAVFKRIPGRIIDIHIRRIETSLPSGGVKK